MEKSKNENKPELSKVTLAELYKEYDHTQGDIVKASGVDVARLVERLHTHVGENLDASDLKFTQLAEFIEDTFDKRQAAVFGGTVYAKLNKLVSHPVVRMIAHSEGLL